jgi:hypothetical protein
MRRVLVLAALAAFAIAAIAAPASAQRVTKIRVVAIQKSIHRVGRTVRARGKLVKPHHRHHRVGRYHARFRPRGRHRVSIRAVAIFRGEGSLKIKGTEGRHDNRLVVIGGTGEFNGAAGKLKTRDLRGNKTLLTFLFVQ